MYRSLLIILLALTFCLSGLNMSAQAVKGAKLKDALPQPQPPTQTKDEKVKDPLPPVTQTTGKEPVIIIPGLTGSELINPKTDRTVWFSIKRDKDDDIRLPMTSTVLSTNRDSLKVGDIIRKVEVKIFPDIEVYQSLIDALIQKGYTEATWDKPQATDVFYVFPYDWRRDNVETAHLLMQKIIAVKRALKRPDLKFDILAHSMGGLIARYAAMYGMADLPRGGAVPVPNWSGAASIHKLMMFGTPNEGSYNALDALLNGSPIVADRKLPLVDDFRPEDVMSTPSAFQLLPHITEGHFFDENLKPLTVDIYDPKTWDKYGWGALNEPKFLGKLRDAAMLSLKNKEIKPAPLSAKNTNIDDQIVSQTTYSQARAYFVAALGRAKRFNAALDVPVKKAPLETYAFGGNCQPTLDGAIISYDAKKEKWTTSFEAKDYKTADGRDVKKDEVKALIFALGDGRVTQFSLLTAASTKPGETAAQTGIFPYTTSFFGCGTHTKLFLDKPIQDSFLSALVVEQGKQP